MRNTLYKVSKKVAITCCVLAAMSFAYIKVSESK